MNHSTSLTRLLATLALALSPAALLAQRPSSIPGLTDKLGLDQPASNTLLLAEPYESPAAGISFRPPLGAKLTAKGDPEKKTVAEFLHENKQWILKVTQLPLDRAMPLQSTGAGPDRRIGLLDYSVEQMKTEQPAAEVLRNEIVNVGENGVGLAIYRFSVGPQFYLRQQALFQAGPSEKLYYIFNFTTPVKKSAKPEDDPNQRLAVDTFKQMVDSIQVLDRSEIKKDQVNRLFRTRALFVDWNHLGGQRIRKAIIPEQWLRIIKDGKDIGYSYVVEENLQAQDAKNNPARAFDGVLISIRTRTKEKDTQVDIGTQMFVSLDRKHEDWANVVNIVANKGRPDEDKKQEGEYGFSEIKYTRKIDLEAQPKPGDKNVPMRDIETYRLSVNRVDRNRIKSKPETCIPSPWYIPQAIGSMLPRLLPLNKPVTYMFQSYVGDQKAVVHRYVDVGFEKTVNFEGRDIKVIPVTDRIRIDGEPTIHYMSPDGKYLGSVNEASRVTILPSDAQTLQKIWGDPNLQKQEDLQHPDKDK